MINRGILTLWKQNIKEIKFILWIKIILDILYENIHKNLGVQLEFFTVNNSLSIVYQKEHFLSKFMIKILIFLCSSKNLHKSLLLSSKETNSKIFKKNFILFPIIKYQNLKIKNFEI